MTVELEARLKMEQWYSRPLTQGVSYQSYLDVRGNEAPCYLNHYYFPFISVFFFFLGKTNPNQELHNRVVLLGKTNPNQELHNRVVLRIECDNRVITAFDHRALAKYICNIIRSSPQ